MQIDTGKLHCHCYLRVTRTRSHRLRLAGHGISCLSASIKRTLPAGRLWTRLPCRYEGNDWKALNHPLADRPRDASMQCTTDSHYGLTAHPIDLLRSPVLQRVCEECIPVQNNPQTRYQQWREPCRGLHVIVWSGKKSMSERLPVPLERIVVGPRDFTSEWRGFEPRVPNRSPAPRRRASIPTRMYFVSSTNCESPHRSSVLVAAHIIHAGVYAEHLEDKLMDHELVMSQFTINELAWKLRDNFEFTEDEPCKSPQSSVGGLRNGFTC